MCDCISKVDEQLADHGIEVNRAFNLGDGPTRTIVDTVRNDGSGKRPKASAPFLHATFCPFCGEKYEAA